MRKWLTGVLAVVLASMVAVPALAAEEGEPRFTDEQRAVLEAKREDIRALQEEGKELHAQVRAQLAAIREQRPAIPPETREQIQHTRWQLITYMAENLRPLHEQAHTLQQALRAAREAGDADKVAELRAELAALREAAAPVRAEAAALREALQQLQQQVQPVREEIRAWRERTAPYQDELKELRAVLRGLHEERRALMTEVREALQDGDFGQVVAGLEQAMRVQKQHNQTLVQILAVLAQLAG